jgi:hypothetical protein
MLRKIYGTNFFHIKFGVVLASKCQNELVLPNGQALTCIIKYTLVSVLYPCKAGLSLSIV